MKTLIKSILKISIVAMAVSQLVGCVYLNSVSITSIPKDRTHKVMAEANKFMFMGFNFNNDYINNIPADLARQCPGGKVQGVLTKDENVDYFLYFFWTKKITAEGYCVKGS